MHILSQYYESKVLYNTEVTWLLTAHPFQKNDIFYKKLSFLLKTLLLTPSEKKLVDYSVQNRSLKLLKKSMFDPFCFEFDQNDNSQGHSNLDCGVNNRPILLFQGVKRSVVSKVSILSLFQNDCLFLENWGPLKIWVLKCYEGLWIHNTDEICSLD